MIKSAWVSEKTLKETIRDGLSIGKWLVKKPYTMEKLHLPYSDR